MLERRKFLRMLFAAPAVPVVGMVSSNVKADGTKKIPKAILVDPYQVNMQDLIKMNIPELKDVKIVRVRRSLWGQGEPIKIIY